MSKQDELIQVANTTDIGLGQSQSVSLNGIDILICHAQDGFFAVEDRCTHSDVPLCGGLIEENTITCPLHGAIFNLTDGSVLSPPAFEDIKSFRIEIDGTSISLDPGTFK
jgi:3-phenylpropionate/trans-cinnamate dioxygenase ferredoxin subunit